MAVEWLSNRLYTIRLAGETEPMTLEALVARVGGSVRDSRTQFDVADRMRMPLARALSMWMEEHDVPHTVTEEPGWRSGIGWAGAGQGGV